MVSSTSIIEVELEKILKSKWLKESAQLSSLLAYVVGESLAGREGSLKEYSLGIEVFHRPKDYDPRNDAIVRVQASLLRKRLASYYENEGKSSPLRIHIPRGRYVAEFQSEEATVDPEPVILSPVPKRWPLFAAGLAAGLVIATLAITLWNLSPAVEGKAVWGAIVDRQVPAIASFGVPLFYTGTSGLYFRDVRVNSPDEEGLGKIPWLGEKLQLNLRPQEDVYTGVGDAIGTHLIARWLEDKGVKVTVANSNYIGPSDFEGRNLIVVASARFQTMLQKMKLESHFHFKQDDVQGAYLIDKPIAGEQQQYRSSLGIGVNIDYAVMSIWPGKVKGTRILYLSGVNTWTTQGAAQFAVDEEKLKDLQQRLDSDPANGPRGARGPYFQVLLQVEGKNNRVRGAKYVTHRYLSGTEN